MTIIIHSYNKFNSDNFIIKYKILCKIHLENNINDSINDENG